MARAGLLLIVLASLMLSACSRLFFMPMEQMLRTPADLGLDYRDVVFHSGDGTPLHGWFLPAEGEARGAVLFLHGNAENISTHIGSVYWLPAAGYHVFLFDYRGYGSSGGMPGLRGVMRDAEAAIDRVVDMDETRDGPVIVFGQSIGAAIAIHAVAHSEHRDRIAALVAESAFSSYRRIAREKLAAFWLTWPFQYPLSWLISDRYAPIDDVSKIAPIPLLLVYSEGDPVVPIHHGRLLFEAAAEPKQFWRIPDGRHIGAFTQPGQRRRLVRYFESVTR